MTVLEEARRRLDLATDIEDIRYWAIYLKGASDQFHEDHKEDNDERTDTL